MKKFYLLFLIGVLSLNMNGQVEGTWKIAPEAGSLAVGPAMGDFSWWSISEGDVATRSCFFDDEYVFNADGTFQNVLGDQTWNEPWQGMDPEGCGAPIAPHDGSAAATWAYDEAAGTITITGTGAYLGLAKVHNGGELGSPGDAVASITYPVVIDGDRMTIDIDFGGVGFWHFVLEKSTTMSSPLEGSWSVAPRAGALAVGPAMGDFSWWSNSEGDVATRSCFFDDEYVFNADGTFQNVLGDQTWNEPWQGMDPEGCGAPIAPHDGSAAATWAYDEAAGTITITGTGAYLGLAKVHNGGELGSPADAVASITYPAVIDGNSMTIDIDFGGVGFWHFELEKNVSSNTIVDIVVNSEDHTVLEQAVIAAGLAETLSGPGPFTLFAPTDAALGSLPAGTLETLLADPTGALKDILLYHALSGDVRSTDLMDGMTATTILGKDITVTINDDGVFINDAKVTVADIVADNGVVHVIDAVLLPPSDPDTDGVIFDFEAPETSGVFQYFGSTLQDMFTEVIANPNASGINTSDSVTMYVKPANSETWAGAFADSPITIDATGGGEVCADVHMDHIGNLAFKMENGNGDQNWTTIVENTVTNEWETLCFNFDNPSVDQTTIPATGNTYTRVVIFFDFGSNDVMDVTSYIDNIRYSTPTSSVEGKSIPVQEFKITPNVTNLMTRVQWEDQSNKVLSIIDSNGRLIQSMNVSKFENERIINVSNLPAGNYFIQLASDKTIGVKQLIVTK